ncbi:hypothetical protein ACQQ2T_08655 [Paraclostridium tenue]
MIGFFKNTICVSIFLICLLIFEEIFVSNADAPIIILNLANLILEVLEYLVAFAIAIFFVKDLISYISYKRY